MFDKTDKTDDSDSAYKESLLKEFSIMNDMFKKHICSLCDDNVKAEFIHMFKASDIMQEIEKGKKTNKNKKCKGNYDFLEVLNGKTGIYIFLDNQVPVYVGKGGTGIGDDLKTRVKNECKIDGTSGDKSSTLSRNIKKSLDEKNEGKLKGKTIKILESFNIVTIDFGDMKDGQKKRLIENQKKSNIFEQILIALFNPIYNKTYQKKET